MGSGHSHPRPSAWRDWPAGTRLVVRRRLPPGEAADSGQRWTDVIGVLVTADDDGLVLRRDPARASSPLAGQEVRVPTAQIEVVKQLPPRPRRRG